VGRVGMAHEDELVRVLMTAARAGAVRIREFYDHRGEARAKPDGSLITEADEASDEAIQACLRAELGSVVIISEEGGMTTRGNSDRAIFVDPLDGTTNFSRSSPSWSVSIGAVEFGAAVAGVVIQPERGIEYWATRDGGTFRRANGVVSGLRREPMAVGRSILSCGCDQGDDRSRDLWKDWMARLAPPFSYRVRVLECAALELCWVAEGGIDGYLHPTDHPWDMSAGGLIAREAGAEVAARTDRHGCRMDAALWR
jgi:myo-inositol-1(or 4)-monophosphatase